jgi:hypothetical protein
VKPFYLYRLSDTPVNGGFCDGEGGIFTANLECKNKLITDCQNSANIPDFCANTTGNAHYGAFLSFGKILGSDNNIEQMAANGIDFLTPIPEEVTVISNDTTVIANNFDELLNVDLKSSLFNAGVLPLETDNFWTGGVDGLSDACVNVIEIFGNHPIATNFWRKDDNANNGAVGSANNVTGWINSSNATCDSENYIVCGCWAETVLP